MTAVALLIFDLAKSIISGERSSPLEIGRSLADIVVQVLPVDDFKPLLDDAAKKRVETAANLAEDAKFGPAKT